MPNPITIFKINPFLSMAAHPTWEYCVYKGEAVLQIEQNRISCIVKIEVNPAEAGYITTLSFVMDT